MILKHIKFFELISNQNSQKDDAKDEQDEVAELFMELLLYQ